MKDPIRNSVILLSVGFFLCLVAQAQGTFYFDADYSGSSDGSQERPFNQLNSQEWDAINDALRGGDVTVYFSCREASSDVSDSHGGSITIQRVDSPYRLTLDGMSKWNSDDGNPSWSNYAGSKTRRRSKHKLTDDGTGWALGWGGRDPVPSYDRLTVRGFEATGSRGRFRLEGGGNDIVIEYNYLHDIRDTGPAIGFNGGAYAYSSPSPECRLRVEHLSDGVTIHGNTIDTTYGEGIYIGGAGDGGFGCPGHRNIVISDNEVTRPASGGGEGDCIDIKNGNTNITISGNHVHRCNRMAMSIQGRSVGQRGPQNVLIEKNVVHDIGSSGRGVGAIGLIVTWETVPDGVVIRNNLIYDTGDRVAISAFDGNSNEAGSGAKYDLKIYNNTVYTPGNPAPALGVKFANGVDNRNNLFIAAEGDGDRVSIRSSNNVVSDYIAVFPQGPGDGSHSVILTASQVESLFVDTDTDDFGLRDTALVIDFGPDLSSTGFDDDINGGKRRDAWDLGADEFEGIKSSPPSAPTGLRQRDSDPL